MRGRFKQQLSLGVIPISEVKINTKSRHQLPPLLKALQYVFVTPKLNKAVFDLLDSHIMSGKKKTGRDGMTLWEVLVLSLVRFCNSHLLSKRQGLQPVYNKLRVVPHFL